MVSLETENIGKYILQNVGSSLLLKCFCNYLFKPESKLSEEELKLLSQNKRDYKSIAAQGFCINNHKELIPFFCAGLRWLLGREISDNNPIVLDNIPLFGIIIGIENIADNGLLKKEREWIKSIVEAKKTHTNQIQYATFFSNLIEGEIAQNSEISFELELSVFNNFIQNKPPTATNNLADYYLQLRTNSFPYYRDDFFRNMVNVFNENQILKNYLLSQDDFEKKINLATKKEANLVLAPIKKTMDIKASNFADGILLIYSVIMLISFGGVVIYVINGDWDFLEPRTFLLSVPLLAYTAQLLYTFITNKEFSFKPKTIMEKIKNKRLKSLYEEFGVPHEK